MSQSGHARGARNRELNALTATWAVWDAASRGQKSSDERTTLVDCMLYRSSVEWHMQLMAALPGKRDAIDASRASW